MPRLIEIDKSVEKRVTHKTCGAVVGYFESEVLTFTKKDITQSVDTYRYINCPRCGEKIILGEKYLYG